MSSVSISGGGYYTNSTTLNTGVLRTAGTNTITATVVDTRGRTASVTQNVTVTAYNRPYASSITLARCNANGTQSAEGTYVNIAMVYG